jgi:N-acetylglucosamine-6-phosphate deacetylase
MDAALRLCVAAGVPLQRALRAASTNPARLLDLPDRGALTPGRRADMVALDPDLQIEQVWVAGSACITT